MNFKANTQDAETATVSKGNVVSIFSKRAASHEDQADQQADVKKDTESFEQVMQRNLANQQRMRQERLSANKSVLKSYRIKN